MLLIHAIFSSSVGKLARFDEIIGKTSAVFLARRKDKKFINYLTLSRSSSQNCRIKTILVHYITRSYIKQQY